MADITSSWQWDLGSTTSVVTLTSSIRVLLCDDHSVVREGLARLLSSAEGIEVVGMAADGAEGVAAAVALRPDVILMDLAVTPSTFGIARSMRMTLGRTARARATPSCPSIASSIS